MLAQVAYVGTMLGSKLAPRADPHLVLLAYVGPRWAHLGLCWQHVGLQVDSERQSPPNSVGLWCPMWARKLAPSSNPDLILLAYVGPILASRANAHRILLAYVVPCWLMLAPCWAPS